MIVKIRKRNKNNNRWFSMAERRGWKRKEQPIQYGDRLCFGNFIFVYEKEASVRIIHTIVACFI